MMSSRFFVKLKFLTLPMLQCSQILKNMENWILGRILNFEILAFFSHVANLRYFWFEILL